MLKKIKNILIKTDNFLYKKFGSDKSTKILENIKEAQIIFSKLNETGKEHRVRFVGGCIRKAICNEEIDDIDLATSLEPQEVKKILNREGIKVIDSGISHGTVSAILNKKKFEITTLRKDISTDGRHANVEFTLQWKEDALRRDFTINAIYSDIEGRILNPVNGISDLKEGIVKFIGLPEERIQEDYLRILRYFRFFAQYSKIEHDNKTIKSIKKNINGLNQISNERIFDEMQKILKLKNLYSLFSKNISNEIILSIFPQFKYFERLKPIKKLLPKIKEKYDVNLILSLLIIDESNNYEYFCHKYKTSNDLKEKFQNISTNFQNLKEKSFYTKKNIKRLIYLTNKNYVTDLLLFSICANAKKNFSNIGELIDFIDICEVPKFPVSGNHLKKYGFIAGKKLGKELKLLEENWINNDFNINKEELKKYLGSDSKN